jgi:hypothetical protein
MAQQDQDRGQDRDFKSIQLRMPLDLHQRFLEIAEYEHRSLHGQLLHVLTDFARNYPERPSNEV